MEESEGEESWCNSTKKKKNTIERTMGLIEVTTDHEWRQAITVASSRCIAALSVERYLTSNNLLLEFHQCLRLKRLRRNSQTDMYKRVFTSLSFGCYLLEKTHKGS
ncbi:unnamed protein product [Camellia sinensis]